MTQTITFGKRAESADVNQFNQWLHGTVGAGDTMSLTEYDGTASYALTLKHKVAAAADQKQLLVKDYADDTIFEIAALNSIQGTYINTDVTKLVISDLRNWTATSDVFINKHRTTAGTTTSYVPVAVEYVTACQPTDGFNGTTNIPDEVGIQCTTLATNTASGAGQNGDVSLRAAEFVCIQYANTGTRSMAALTLGMHTAVAQTSFLDNSSVYDDFFGSCGIIMLTQDSSARTGFGTNVAANCGYLVAGTPTWKFGFAYLDGSNNRLFTVDSGGTIRFRGNLIFETGVAGQRIRGDFTSATASTRTMFTTTTTDGTTDVGAAPVGTATKASFSVYGAADMDNAEGVRMYVNGTGALAVLETFKTGAATARELSIRPGQTEALRLLVNGNVCFPDAGLVTTATAGFLYIPSCAGIPTGVPTTFAGTNALVFDRTNDKLSVYRGGWKQTAQLV